MKNTPAVYKGNFIWQKVNTETGEIVNQREVAEFEKNIDGRTEKFMVTYLAEIINLIDNLGNKKMQVVKYILQNMAKSNNTMTCTVRELAKKTNTSYQTTQQTLKLLEQANIIQRKTGSFMVSPKLMNNWKAPKEATMMITYRDYHEEINITPKGENNEILE